MRQSSQSIKAALLDPRPADRPDNIRTRPRLSPDRIGRHFTVQLESGHVWSAPDVRFVIWYHVRTVLSFDTIAAAFNATYPNSEMQMTGRHAQVIYEVVQSRWPDIKQHLRPAGHYPFPDADGWHPCDLGMCCATLALKERSRSCVVFKAKASLKGVNLFRELATGIWEGNWEDLLLCPRAHEPDGSPDSDGPASTSLLPENEEPASIPDAPPTAHSSVTASPLQTHRIPDSSQKDPNHDQPLPRFVLLHSGPNAIIRLVGSTSRSIILLWLWTTFFEFLDKAGTMQVSTGVTVLVVVLNTGVGLWLDWFLKIFIKDQMLIFKSIGLHPPLAWQYIVIRFFLGIFVGGMLVTWKGWWTPRQCLKSWTCSLRDIFPNRS